MLPTIDTILHDKCRLEPGRHIIVGVSGGPDSLCLMDILRQAGYPIIVAHFNHKLREEADLEANVVEKMAARLGLPSVIESADVRAFADENKLSVEDAARSLRYRFLFAQARNVHAQAVAVGHTADDQVETVLMHFLRGAGLTGLKGMIYRAVLPIFDSEIPLVRPLLDVWREETVIYCAGRGLRPRHDPSNDSLNFLRNRIRHLLIPSLETYNPKFREAAWRAAQSLTADFAILQDAVSAAWTRVAVSESEQLVVFDSSALAELSAGLQRYLFRRAIERLNPASDTTYASLERILSFLADAQRGGSLFLSGGIRLIRESGQVFVAAEDAVLPFERWPQLSRDMDTLPLHPPCHEDLPGGWRLTCEPWTIPALAREQMKENEDPFQAWLDAGKFQGDLSLRVRKEGDRFEPFGLDGHSQKVSDFFTNVKLPQRARDRWPLLCAGETIAWIPGYQIAYPYRLTKSSRKILYFTLTPPAEKKGEQKPGSE